MKGQGINIAWPTHNRSESLLRSISSLKNHGLNLKLFISNSGQLEIEKNLIDKNISATILEGNRRREWINLLKEKSEKEGISHEVISFALNPDNMKDPKVITTGANRNLLFLNHVGEKFLSVDDDVVFDIRKISSNNSKKFIPGTFNNPLSTTYFSDLEELNRFKNQMPSLTLADFLNDHKEALSYQESGKRCGMSLSGYFGDSGFQSSRNIFALDEASIEHLVEDEKNLRHAIQSRILWRVTDFNKMMEISPAMPICAGFSNDLELPPFFPMGRNQDGAFAYAMAACLDSVFVGHLDMSISHAPLETRSYSLRSTPLQMRANDLVALVWVELLKEKKEKSYDVSSAHFKKFSRSENFGYRLKELASRHFEARSRTLESKIQNLKKRNDPKFQNWIQFAEVERELCVRAYQISAHMIPEEALGLTLNENEAIELTRTWFEQYADLLAAWPMIRKIAATL